MNRRDGVLAICMLAVAGLVLAAMFVLQGCAPGIHAWTADDTRKATEIDNAASAELALCSDEDGGTCRPSHIRALSELAKCKAASMLNEHRAPVPGDAGECPQ